MARSATPLDIAAIVGNGRLLAGVNAAGMVLTLTWPHLDYPQHLAGTRLALAGGPAGRSRRWLDGPGWRHNQEYLRGTDVLRTTSRHGRTGIEVEQHAVAHGDALMIGVRVSGAGGARMIWEVSPQVGGQPLANALTYDPDRDALVSYFRDFALAAGVSPAPKAVRARSAGAGGSGQSRPGGQRVSVVGVVSAEFELVLADKRVTLLILVPDGSQEVAIDRLVTFRRRLAEQGWPAEFSAPPLAGATRAMVVDGIQLLDKQRAAAADCYARSILTIAQLTDRSGALIAGPPVDQRYQGSAGYAYCWPRDGAFIARALDIVGERGASRAFFEWVLDLQPESGIWLQRYFADGRQAPSWTPHQLDETGAVLWALDHHLTVAFDAGLADRGLRAAVRAFSGIARLAAQNGWPPPTQNLWEDQWGVHLYTLAALLAAATAWLPRARDREELEAIAVLEKAQTQLQAALEGWPLDPKTGALARALVIDATGMLKPDFTADASLLGLSVPFGVLPTDDMRLQATVRLVEQRLASRAGRVLRYTSDAYRGGNPWPLFTLWLAWHHLRAGNRGRALRLYERALGDRTPAGLYSEQVDARSGEAVWVVPLAWTHAWFLEVTHALLAAASERSRDFFFSAGNPSAHELRRARALYGGLFHNGLAVAAARGTTQLEAESWGDAGPATVTAEIAGGPAVPLVEVSSNGHGGGIWRAALPLAGPGTVLRYRIRGDRPGKPAIFAADADPQPGQVFELEVGAPEPPDWTADALAYHLLVDRFARPEGRPWPPLGSATRLYGGTLEGVRQHLDHIAGLGVNLLWLSPVFSSPSHHGYDPTDHFTVEARYGGAEALRGVIEAAHTRGMRVLLDFVPNHTGRGHPLFRKAVAEDSDAAEFYRFWQWPHYYRAFYDHIVLPELDTSREVVQRYLVEAARHWVTEYGVDGYRLDYVPGVDPAFWVRLRRELRALRPDVLLLGEVAGSDADMAAYRGRLDGVIDFRLAELLRGTFAERRLDLREFDRQLERHERTLAGLVRGTMLDNHDMNRFLWLAGGDKTRLRLGATALLTLPGMPIIYYGTEVGLSQRGDGVAENAEARLPMPWDAGQDADLLTFVQRLGRLRRESAALRRGTRKTLLADEAVYAFRRQAGDDAVLVVLNRSERPQRRRLKAGGGAWVDRMNVATVGRDGSDLEVLVPPQAGAILGDATAGR